MNLTLFPILVEVDAEVRRACTLHPYSIHLPDGTGLTGAAAHVLAQVRHCYERAKREGRLTHALILEEEFWEAMAESDPVKLRAELVQVAAMAVKWIADLDSRKESQP